MAELLLEIFSEEIPARMQVKAAANLGRLLSKSLNDAGFEFTDIQTFSGPRRLTLVIADLPEKSPDVTEERKGPRVGAPEQAMAGFLRGAGVTQEQCEQREDKKGKFWVAKLHKPGRSALDVLAEAIPQIMASFPWPKSMKWGSGNFRWVRPLHSIICLFDGKVVPFEVAGVQSGNQTSGHRIMGQGAFEVSSFADYQEQLEGAGHVLLDAADRKAKIAQQITEICQTEGLSLVEDEGLLDEVAGLAEWPVTLLGQMDKEFLDLPPEVITLSMAKHQKYFSVNNAKTGKLAPNFLVVANLDAPDGGKAIVSGNQRVLTARLADARHFWDTDRQQTLESRIDALRDVVFHQKLGSVYDKAMRVAALAEELAPLVGADPKLAKRAAMLAKADLTTQMVVEFTSLQGVMGRYYALADGEEKPVADAIADHYKPQGPTDQVPTDPVSIAVALADKLDTLVGFWAIDEKPTGSKDPYALRRAALGGIRLVLGNEVRLDISHIVKSHFLYEIDISGNGEDDGDGWGFGGRWRTFIEKGLSESGGGFGGGADEKDAFFAELADDYTANLLSFFHDRLKVHLRDSGIRHDLIDAVLTPDADDLVLIVDRVKALSEFLETSDGTQLLAGTKRAANIVKAEHKKTKQEISGEVDENLLTAPQEKALYAALQTASKQAAEAIKVEDYTAAMAALAPLRQPIDAFFDAVMVNDDDPAIRQNRLRLLSGIGEALAPVADFDKISG
ncbi:MAG: glycine--tRNA ligase subunit beta [Robiginitomaculum sp.]|nr:glycine--tRNA ligase subunit beta [Robiginitomaculum sp.]